MDVIKHLHVLGQENKSVKPVTTPNAMLSSTTRLADKSTAVLLQFVLD